MRSMVCCVILPSIAFLLAGCKDQVPPDNGESPSNIIFPADSVSYSRHVQRLFDQTCAIPSCHDDVTRRGGLSLTTYENLRWNAPQIEVVPGQPDGSVLVLRIEGRLGDRMPLYRNPLNDNQVNGIRAWVVAGALNN